MDPTTFLRCVEEVFRHGVLVEPDRSRNEETRPHPTPTLPPRQKCTTFVNGRLLFDPTEGPLTNPCPLPPHVALSPAGAFAFLAPSSSSSSSFAPVSRQIPHRTFFLYAAAEIKHGRVSMLAVVGFLLTQYVHLPGDQFQAGPLEALTTVPAAAQAQVFTCECP